MPPTGRAGRPGRRGPPQDVRPGREHGAGQRPGQEVPVGQYQHARSEGRQQVQGQRLLPGAVPPERRPGQRPGPGLGRRHPPHLRERPVPGRGAGPAEEPGVLLAVRRERLVSTPTEIRSGSQPAPNTAMNLDMRMLRWVVRPLLRTTTTSSPRKHRPQLHRRLLHRDRRPRRLGQGTAAQRRDPPGDPRPLRRHRAGRQRGLPLP
jgi:hypothetical protein